MRFLEDPFIREWCREHAVAITEPDDTIPRLLEDPALSHASRLVFAPHGRSGYEPGVASAILHALGCWDECLLWVTGWGVWPSSENWPRYHALRARHGEKMSLDMAPGHLVTPEESAEFFDLLLQVLENGWDAFVLPALNGEAAPLRLRISHDGWVIVRSGEPFSLVVPGLSPESV
jgi:hypothetical protein